MGYVYYKKKANKKPYRRPRKKIGLRYKRAFRGNYNFSKINTTVIGNQHYAKLCFGNAIQQFQVPPLIGGVSGRLEFNILANGMNPIGEISQSAVANTPAINLQQYGNSVGQAGASLTPSNTVTPGCRLLQGLQAYANLFRKFCIFDNSIKFKVFSDSTAGASTNVNLQVIGSAWNYGAATPAELQAVTDDTFTQQKGMKRRMISGGGGRNWAHLSMHRSSKKILGFKDVKDNTDAYCVLNRDLLANGQMTNPGIARQWYYNFRVINNTDTPINISISWYQTMHLLFTERELWLDSVSNDPSPPAPPV